MSATATKEAPAKTKSDKMFSGKRLPCLGRIVLWRADRSSPPTPAIVVVHGINGRLTLHVIHEHASNFDRRDGVPFIDSDFRDEDMKESGCWDFIDDDK